MSDEFVEYEVTLRVRLVESPIGDDEDSSVAYNTMLDVIRGTDPRNIKVLNLHRTK